MALKSERVEEKQDGKFYVDMECIGCDNCQQIAPHHFTLVDCQEYAFVYKQPKTESELKQCEKALKECPVDAIGSDGEGL